MADTFHDMNKINDLSDELIKYLERFKDWAGGVISYEDHLEYSSLHKGYLDDGYDEYEAESRAIQYATEFYEPHPMEAEYKKAKELIALLKQFTMKES
jgi:hypothetical protein